MNPSSLTNSDAGSWRISKNILSVGDLTGKLTLLAPGAESPESETGVDRVLFVATGSVIATMNRANYILDPDETLYVPAGRALILQNRGTTPAKVFELTLPARKRHDDAPVFTL